MDKLPEEGEIWEWRAFGAIDAGVAAAVTAHPIRFGIFCHGDEDIYLVSPGSNQNVKLRRSRDSWQLKFKLLVAVEPDLIELYRESVNYMYSFPVTLDKLRETAELLLTELPAYASERQSFDPEAFTQVLSASSPPIRPVKVPKTRSQFMVEDGWIELADVHFPGGRVQSLSIHSPDVEAVRRTLGRLKPDSGLETMNYVEACRKWGRPDGLRERLET